MDFQAIEKETFEELERTTSLADLDSLEAKVLGRKDGSLTKILRNIGSLPAEERKTAGQAANLLREKLEEKFAAKRISLQSSSLKTELETQKIDTTLPGTPFARGHSHPVIQTISEITRIFQTIGFNPVEGPDIETEFNNFGALNFPENHPARDAHDTFYLAWEPYLLRTHTSPVQIRLMKAVKPPVRIIAPGRVFRHEAVDATHAATFHQIEGLAIDTDITFADLKGVLTHFAQKYFGEEAKVRFRPSYFPFVEPGAEMDLQCFLCHGAKVTEKGEPCHICKASGWIEMLGAGMVHPQVLRNVGYNPEKYTGFAFGMGIERIVMTRYQIRDIRFFLDSDLRFLEQFV